MEQSIVLSIIMAHFLLEKNIFILFIELQGNIFKRKGRNVFRWSPEIYQTWELELEINKILIQIEFVSKFNSSFLGDFGLFFF